MRPVQPVWWLAPRPLPVSAWKYSWKGTCALQSGSRSKRFSPPNTGRRPFSSHEKEARQPPGELVGDLCQRQAPARSRRTLDAVVVPEVLVERAQRLDQQVVDRKPDRTRASWSCRRRAAYATRRARSRRDGWRPARSTTNGWLLVVPRQRADAERREELALIEHVAEHLPSSGPARRSRTGRARPAQAPGRGRCWRRTRAGARGTRTCGA